MSQDAAISIALRMVDQISAPMNKAMAMVERSTMAAEKRLASLEGVARKLAGAFAGFQLGKFVTDASMMAARYETLGVVMANVGRNAGYSQAEMEGFSLGLQKNGIAMIESRGILTRMAQAHIDLSHSTDLSRIAQDAAVIGNINSSEAFERMIHGIQSGQIDVLRTIGINVNFENSYKSLAMQLHKTTADLSENEKMQARVNVVLAAGETIAGTYEAAMGTTGKQILSMTRYWDNLKVTAGGAFLAGLAEGTKEVTGALKDTNQALSDNKEQMDRWSATIKDGVATGIADIKFGFDGLKYIFDQLPASVVGAAGVGLIGLMLFGPTGAIAAGSLTFALDQLRQMRDVISEIKAGNIYENELTYENTGLLTSKAGLLDIARRRKAQKGASSASADILNGPTQTGTFMPEGLLALESTKTIEGLTAERIAAEKLAAATAAAAKASKDYAKEVTSTLDRLLPLHKEQKDFAHDMAILDGQYAKGKLTVADYITAQDNLIMSTAGYTKAEKDATEAKKEGLDNLSRQMDNLNDIADKANEAIIAGMTEQESALYKLSSQFDQYREALIKASFEGMYTLDEFNAAMDRLDDRQAEATTKAIEGFQDKNDQVKKIWEHTFDNLQDITADWLYDFKFDITSIGDLFRKMVAQMVSAWAWGQASMAWTGGPAGVANVAGAAGGAASAASAAGTGFSLASAGSVLSNFASTAFSWDVIGHAGAFAVNHGLETLGTAAMDTANWLNDLPIVGDLGLAGVFSAISAFNAFSTGNEIGGIAHTAATIAAVSGFPVVAAAIEAVNFLGELSGLWGKDKENTFTMTELVQPGVVTDTSFNRSTGFDDPGWQHPAGGNEWYHSIADAYADTVAAAQKVFDEQVFALVSQLPEEMKNQILAELEATDYQKMLLEASGGRWGVSGAKDALQGVAKNIVTTLTTTLSTAYATSLSDYITSQGAAGLVGDSAVWAVLSDRARDTINDLFTSAAATIKGGDVDGGIAEINKVTQTISQIAQALAPIQEAVDIADLTDYQKSLRSLNQLYAQHRTTLAAAGVDLERLTILTAAYNRSLLDLATENVATEAAAYMSGLETELDRLQNNVDTTRDRYLTLLTREHDALDDLTDTLGDSINSIRRARKNLYDEGGSLLPGESQLAGINAEIDRIMAVALGSDPKAAAKAMGEIEDLSGEYVSVAKSLRTDWRDYARDLAKINNLLDVTEAQAVTLKSDAQQQIDKFDVMIAAVEGSTETALTIDEARTAYEQAVYDLEASGFQSQLEIMTSLYGTATNIEKLLADYLQSVLDLGTAQTTAGRTGEWVQTGGWQTWTSTGGAVGQAPAGATSLEQVEIVGKNGLVVNAQSAVDWVNGVIGAAGGDPAALRDAAVQISGAARDYGVSEKDLDLMMGWAPGASSAAVDQYDLEHFATGGSFVANGPSGVDNLALPGLRVSAGEMVHVSRPDTMAGLRNEIRELKQTVAKLLQEGNRINTATAVHAEKIASVMRRIEDGDTIRVKVENDDAIKVKVEA